MRPAGPPAGRARAAVGLVPTYPPEVARSRGRYVLENDEKVDVILARGVPTVDGVRVDFDELWTRRRTISIRKGTPVAVPSIPDLILTKRFGARPNDVEDVRLLVISGSTRSLLREEAERPLPPDEFARRLSTPIEPSEEAAAGLDLIRWFARRYPTVAGRLAYARRAYARCVRGRLM